MSGGVRAAMAAYEAAKTVAGAANTNVKGLYGGSREEWEVAAAAVRQARASLDSAREDLHREFECATGVTFAEFAACLSTEPAVSRYERLS